ncbi:MAG: lipid-A-disaccharide synthase [Pseudolabrys sp.]
MSPHIFLVAAEESGDRLGASLIAAIRRRCPGARFSGVGGSQMAAQGVASLFPLGELAIIGFVAIFTNLPNILSRIRQTADAVIAAKPDVLVIIDSPDFTHRVAHRVRARAPHIPIVDYVCPSVWAWRSGRARAMTHYVDYVLALLPFEPKVMRELGGPPCTYVGHPLIEQLSELRPNAEEARRRLADPPRLVVLPGSRGREIRRMAGIFGEAVALAAARTSALEVVVPSVPRLADEVRSAVAAWRVPARVVSDADEKHAAFRTARAALVKSGTSTLELALAGVPMVTAYKVPLVEEVVGRALLKVDTVILANLVLGEILVPEFLQADCNAEALAGALVSLLVDSPERRRQIEAFGRLDGLMATGQGAPSDRAAALVLDCAGGLNQPMRETVASALPSA